MKKFDWKEIQQVFDKERLLYKDLKLRFKVSNGAIQKAIRRREFVPRSMAEADVIRETRIKRKHSQETKQKLSKAHIKFLDEHPEFSPWRLSHSSHKSYPEKVFENALISSRIKGWKYNYPVGRFCYDFAFLKQKIDVEIDGGTHNKPEVKKIDVRRDKWSRSKGWTVIRFTAKQVRNDLISCLNKLTIVLQENGTK